MARNIRPTTSAFSKASYTSGSLISGSGLFQLILASRASAPYVDALFSCGMWVPAGLSVYPSARVINVGSARVIITTSSTKVIAFVEVDGPIVINRTFESLIVLRVSTLRNFTFKN